MEENTQNETVSQAEPKIEAESKIETEPKQEKVLSPEEDIKENKIWAVLAYLGALALIPLLVKKDSPFAQFHAKQGVVLIVGWIVSWVPFFGGVIALIVFVFSIIGIINVLSGAKKQLPIIGELAEKINL